MSAAELSVGGRPVWIGALKHTFGSWWDAQRQHYSRLFLIADADAYEPWRGALPLPTDTQGLILRFRDGDYAPGAAERYKNLSTCERIWAAMLEARLDRKALVVNFGGGVVGDIGGFCAAVYKRGVDFIHIPTTLLAMTDAALGGKVGIDFGDVKNAIGAFRPPAAVFADPSFLQTLPRREWSSGLVEVIKHAYIGAPDLLERLRQDEVLVQAPHCADAATWTEVLSASIRVKARIVDEDPREEGLRALLNFGHTFGHALESYFLHIGHPITHGEAVAVGILCERETPVAREVELLKPLLPAEDLRQVPWPQLWAFMQQDKKNERGQVYIAVPGERPFTWHRIALTAEEAERRWRRCLEWIQ